MVDSVGSERVVASIQKKYLRYIKAIVFKLSMTHIQCMCEVEIKIFRALGWDMTSGHGTSYSK